MRGSVRGIRRELQVGLTPIMEYHTLRYLEFRSFGTQTRGSGKIGEGVSSKSGTYSRSSIHLSMS